VDFGIPTEYVHLLAAPFIRPPELSLRSPTETYPVDIVDEIALYIHSSIFTLLGVLGTFGFVGSLVRSRTMVTAFSVGIAIHLGLSIGSGVFTIYSVFKQAPDNAIAACMEGKTDEETRKICQTGMSLVKGAIVAIYVIAWLIELCKCPHHPSNSNSIH
jgi:ABC-type transport system involved in multi-copper enzyme maturation permease subunit